MNAKLPWAVVQGLRLRHARARKTGKPFNKTQEALRLGVNVTTIQRICRNETWKESNGTKKRG